MNISITLILVVVTVLISYPGFKRQEILDLLKHSPYMEVNKNEWYRLITSGFVHADWIHLGVNMYVLYEFGTIVEERYFMVLFESNGRLLYLLMYILAIMAGALPSLLKEKENIAYGAIGASGAVSAVVFIFIMMAPWSMLGIMFIIPMPAVVAGVAFLWYSSWASKRNVRSFSGRPVGHMAHFYGAIFGMVFVSILKPEVLMLFWTQLINPPWFG
jgi:membrane associated rhomboid family serine protease